jgi:vacuole morphology and inheritance protein 14
MFKQVLNDVVKLFGADRMLLERKGSLIIRKLCVLLDARSIYITLAEVLRDEKDHEFASLIVQTLNLILLTAAELVSVFHAV